MNRHLVLLKFVAVFSIAECTGDATCEYGDSICRSVEGDGSYCKYWLSPPVCQGSFNSVCSCRESEQDSSSSESQIDRIRSANAECSHDAPGASYCRFWDENPTCQGAEHIQCAAFLESQEREQSDQCLFHQAKAVDGKVWGASISSIKACVDSTTITHAQALWTLHNLLYGVSEGYSYTKLAVNSSASTYDNDCGYSIYNISVDLETELKTQIGQYTIRLNGLPTQEEQMVFLRTNRPSYPFHSNLVRLFNSLRDAHTTYTSPYSTFTLFYPFGLDSHIDSSGNQVLTVRFSDSESLQTITHLYQMIYNESLPVHLHGGVIRSINDMDPIAFLIDQVNNSQTFDHMYQGINQRINQFFFVQDTISISLGSQIWPELDSLDLKIIDPITNDVVAVSLNLVGRVVGDDSWSPHSTDYLSFNAFINDSSEFEKFQQYDAETNPDLSSLWRLTSATAHVRRDSKGPPHRRLLETKPNLIESLDTSRQSHHALTAQFSNDTVIVRVPSFFVSLNKTTSTYFEEMIRVQSLAKSAGISKILIDVSRNSGGYIPAANAFTWFFVPDVNNICQPVAKRMTWNWQSWFQSFGTSVSELYKNLELEGGLENLGKDHELILDQISDYILFYESVLNSLSPLREKFVLLTELLSDLESDSEKGQALMDFFTSFDDAGLYPLWTGEVSTIDGSKDEPRTRVYTDLETVLWGNEYSQITQKRPFKACVDIVERMEQEFGTKYDRDYWSSVAIVSDGGCGSACSQFVTSMQLNDRAKVFTYGGIATMQMDASAFTGGSVNSYDTHWRKVSVSERFGDLITLGKSDWSRLHKDTWVHSPMPFPHLATANFNWNMIFYTKLGENSLPREYYEIPSHMHLALWAHDDAGIQKIYHTIIKMDWDKIKSNLSCQKPVLTSEFTV